jgi:hypothetical protein
MIANDWSGRYSGVHDFRPVGLSVDANRGV